MDKCTHEWKYQEDFQGAWIYCKKCKQYLYLEDIWRDWEAQAERIEKMEGALGSVWNMAYNCVTEGQKADCLASREHAYLASIMSCIEEALQESE